MGRTRQYNGSAVLSVLLVIGLLDLTLQLNEIVLIQGMSRTRPYSGSAVLNVLLVTDLLDLTAQLSRS